MKYKFVKIRKLHPVENFFTFKTHEVTIEVDGVIRKYKLWISDVPNLRYFSLIHRVNELIRPIETTNLDNLINKEVDSDLNALETEMRLETEIGKEIKIN